MSQTIQPLKSNWKLEEDAGNVKGQIKDRVNSEDNLTWSLGWPIIKSNEIKKKRMYGKI